MNYSTRRPSLRLGLQAICLALVYTLVITLLTPFGISRVEAAPAPNTNASTNASAPASTQNQSQGNNGRRGKRKEGELLVRFRQGVSEADKTRVVEARGARRGRRLRGRSRLEKIALGQGQNLDTIADLLKNLPEIERVEPNYLIEKQGTMADDPRFSEQWHLRNTSGTADIRATDAWDAMTGSTNTIIAIVDSGIDFTHPDLINNQWTKQTETANNNADDDNNGLVDDRNGWDWIAGNSEIKDGQGHGTALAGIIAAQGNNQTGISGVMWRASLMSLRVLDNTGTGTVGDAVEAIDYAIDNGAQIINCSWGTPEESLILKDAIERANQRGVVIVASAGNDASDNDQSPYYPASYDLPNLISVASTTNTDQLANTSNWGASKVTIAAPGVNILTTKKSTNNNSNTGEYLTMNGTSAAAAVVSGVVGLIRTLRPRLNADATKAALVQNARQASALNGKVQANGIVQAALTVSTVVLLPQGTNESDNNNDGGHEGGNTHSGNGGTGGGTTGTSGQNPNAPPPQPGKPAQGLPNLDIIRNEQPTTPRTPAPIRSRARDYCPPDKPDCAGAVIRMNSGTNGAEFVWQSVPTQMVAGKVYQVAVRMRNTGTRTWYPGGTTPHRLGSQNPGDNSTWRDGRVELTAVVAPESEYTFTFSVTAPTTAGTYNFQWKMLQEGVEWFGGLSDNLAVNVQYSSNSASFVSQTVPSYMIAGQPYNVSVTMQNTGTTTWQMGPLYRLGSYNPYNNNTWGTARVQLPQDVPPQTNVTFNFTVTAPTSGGTQAFQWQMVRDGVEWFGSPSTYQGVSVSVVGAGGEYTGTNLAVAELDPINRTGTGGVDSFSRNLNWSLPLVGLPGRAGLDAGLSLSYNSMVWTRAGSWMFYDSDQGTPSPGFRLGLPMIKERTYNELTGIYFYRLVTPSGARVELRQIGSSNVYEAVDSSYTQIVENNANSLTLKTTDGSQLYFTKIGYNFYCSSVKDSNGNFINVSYDTAGRILTLTDTLGRVLNFTYDGNNRLQKITQTWRVFQNNAWTDVTHEWATFGYANVTVNPSFAGGLINLGPNNQTLSMLSQVGLPDGSRIRFEYTGYGQVSAIKRDTSSDAVNFTERSSATYTYNVTAGADRCPRIYQQKDKAENWIGGAEAVTTYDGDLLSWGQVTLPDGKTQHKDFYDNQGWQRGLVTRTITSYEGVEKRSTTTQWTQDDANANLNYMKNPRVTESNIYDPEGNRKRTSVTYTDYGLPAIVYEYKADGASVLRRTQTEYNLSSDYVNNRIIGLVSESRVYDDQDALMSKVTFEYDDYGVNNADLQHQADYPQHDNINFTNSFKWRGNLTGTRRWNVFQPTNVNQSIASKIGYNTAGSVIFARDPLGRQSNISYADSFADGTNNRNTYAYPTQATDADNFSATAQYNYNFGAATLAKNAKGVGQRTEFDGIGRVSQVTQVYGTPQLNGAYVRYVYGTYWRHAHSTPTDSSNPTQEHYQNEVFDGHGRVFATAGILPNSTGGYVGQYTTYNALGQTVSQSNPTEMYGSWAAAGDDSTGWRYSYQSYDWKGRPTVSTNTDGTTSQVSYGGCGCAGGETVTTQDELGRQQKTYHDVLGRVAKAEDLNQNGTVYRTAENFYNGRDQAVRGTVREGTSGASQETVMTYDGHGRPETKRTPEQDRASSFAYNLDDTLLRATDARGATATYTYNNRRMVTGITYGAPTGVQATPNASFTYDEVGNRTQMTVGVPYTTGHQQVNYVYNAKLQLESETRRLPDLAQSYTLTYSYNAGGALAGITDPFGAQVNYAHNAAGQVREVTGAGFAGVTQYMSGAQYRAWGALKRMTANGRTTDLEYDVRLRVARFSVSDLMNAEYGYYADGKIQSVKDLRDNKFDRAYRYDQLGRLAEAFTGAQARAWLQTGQITGVASDGPYHQIYSQNVWNNLVMRDGMNWQQRLDGFIHTYTNNRNSWWQYDADGRPTAQDSAENSYDAVGRLVSVRDPERGGTSHDELIITRTFDADGAQVKKAVNTGITNYYIPSSVLGGSMVVELDGAGNKRRGYVYAGGSAIAEQIVKTDGSVEVDWLHRDPVTGSASKTTSLGTTYQVTQLDPLGVNAGVRPPPAGLPPDRGLSRESDMLFPVWGDATILDRGCSWDGIISDCNIVMRLMATGSAVGGFADKAGKVQQVADLHLLGSGLVWVDRWVDYGSTGDGQFTLDEDGTAHYSDAVTSGSRNVGFFIDVGSMLPQGNIRRLDPDKLITFLRDTDGSTSYGTGKERSIRDTILGFLTEKCGDAMVGLPSVGDLMERGLVIGPGSLLHDGSDKNLQYMGITKDAFSRNKKAADAGGVDGFTIRDRSDLGRQTTDGRVRIFLNSSGFNNLAYTLMHELLHAAGLVGKDPGYGIYLGQDDLSWHEKYDDIMEACAGS